MAFTVREQESVFLVEVFGTERRGELALPVQQLLTDRRRTPNNPIVIDRTRLQASDVDLTELLEFLLYIERNRAAFANGPLYFVHQATAHPAPLSAMFAATAKLRSMEFFEVCDTLDQAFSTLRLRR